MWTERAWKWLLPREDHFFDLMEGAAGCARSGAALLQAACTPGEDTRQAVASLMDAQHASTLATRRIFDALNATFVAPLERTDIFAIGGALERTVDTMAVTGQRAVLPLAGALPGGTEHLALLVRQACDELGEAMPHLRSPRTMMSLRRHCRRVHALERTAQEAVQAHLATLFQQEQSPIELMQRMQLLQHLRRTVESCDEVAGLLEGVIIKNM